MYNCRVKFFNNGSIQLTKFDRPVVLKKMEDNDFDLYDDDCMNDITDSDSVSNLKDISDSSSENIIRSMRRTKNKVIDYGRNNVWDWFYTFTFSPDMVDSKDDLDTLSKKIRQWFNNQKKRHFPNAKYLLIPELHKDGQNWHFHALGSGFDFNLSIAINPKNGKPLKKHGKTIYNVLDYKLGFSTATRITDSKKTVSYVLKYITKDLCEDLKGKHKYYVSNNCELPLEQTFMSYDLMSVFQDISETYNMQLSFSKTIEVDTPDYQNTISYFEFESIDSAQ